jgi:hypothetical protein
MATYFELDAFFDDDGNQSSGGNGEESAEEGTNIPDDVEPVEPEA